MTGLAYLREHLDLESVGHGQWVARCPVTKTHRNGDQEPSLNITLRRDQDGRWRIFLHCPPCGANGNDVCASAGMKRGRALWPSVDDVARMEKPKYSRPLPSPVEIKEWQRCLRGNVLLRLQAWRGIYDGTFKKYGVGWDGACYTLPVYERGKLVNVRRCAYLGGLRGWAGATSRRFYPEVPTGSWALLVEGEWDALMGRSHGLPTLTTTGGARTWPDRRLRHLRGQRVAICLDSDLTGRTAAQTLAQKLSGIAAEIRCIDLYPDNPDKPSGPKDLSDWFNKSGRTKTDLLDLIRPMPLTDSSALPCGTHNARRAGLPPDRSDPSGEKPNPPAKESW